MNRHPQNDWGTVRYDARFDEYWIPAGGLRQCLFFCPWCGETLPPSRRDAWFDAFEAQGLDPFGDAVPEAHRSGAWRGAETHLARREARGGPIAGRVFDLFGEDEESEPA